MTLSEYIVTVFQSEGKTNHTKSNEIKENDLRCKHGQAVASSHSFLPFKFRFNGIKMVSKDSVYENLYKLRQLLICEIQNVTGYPLKSAIKSYFYDLEQKVFSLEFKNLVVFFLNPCLQFFQS